MLDDNIILKHVETAYVWDAQTLSSKNGNDNEKNKEDDKDKNKEDNQNNEKENAEDEEENEEFDDDYDHYYWNNFVLRNSWSDDYKGDEGGPSRRGGRGSPNVCRWRRRVETTVFQNNTPVQTKEVIPTQ